MDSQKQQAADRIKQANSILVTVSANPSVDQLAACIGLTLALNKFGKHATAVFSGAVPSTIEFLQPDKTIEKNTDSLRDFIIALDKSKADKLRYKVEDTVVKIFITPYRTSISEKDLDFSQGDFNVDAIVALGVHNQAELDQVITAHGRILHDATVVTVNFRSGGDDLGGINWLEPTASSLSELSVELIDELDKSLLDKQIATALLTGIVAETDRFSNMQTSPQTMSVSAQLMAAGADQQLVAAKLEAPAPAPVVPIPNEPSLEEAQQSAAAPAEPPKPDDGTLEITHDDKAADQEEGANEEPQSPAPEPPQPMAPAPPIPQPFAMAPEEERQEPAPPQIHIDEHGSIKPLEDTLPPIAPEVSGQPSIIRHHEEMAPAEMGADQPSAEVTGGEGYLAAPTTPPVFGTDDDDNEGPSGGAPQQGGFIIGEHAPGVGDGNVNPGEAQQAPETANGMLAQPPIPPLEQAPVAAVPNTLPPASMPAEVIEPAQAFTPPAGETLSDLEKDVRSPHSDTPPATPAVDNAAPMPPSMPMSPPAAPVSQPVPNDVTPSPALPLAPEPQPVAQEQEAQAYVDRARDAVADALENAPATPATQLDTLNVVQPPAEPTPEQVPVQQPPVMQQQPEVSQYDPNAPPPLPPPMMPPPGAY